MGVLNFGSLNIDRVMQVEGIVRPGETILSTAFLTFAGGKGANQSVALAKAGATVMHAGKIGFDGKLLIDKLTSHGVDTRLIMQSALPTGQAIIQVDKHGQNAIVVAPGANHDITRDDVDRVLCNVDASAILLLQNEISETAYLIEAALRKRMRVCFNPAPYAKVIADYPLNEITMLIVNENEGTALAGVEEPGHALQILATRARKTEIVMTLGSRGVIYRHGDKQISVAAPKVKAVDTTAAGDTFLGFFLASRERGDTIPSALEHACRAAAMCVTRAGAMDSIPTL